MDAQNFKYNKSSSNVSSATNQYQNEEWLTPTNQYRGHRGSTSSSHNDYEQDTSTYTHYPGHTESSYSRNTNNQHYSRNTHSRNTRRSMDNELDSNFTRNMESDQGSTYTKSTHNHCEDYTYTIDKQHCTRNTHEQEQDSTHTRNARDSKHNSDYTRRPEQIYTKSSHNHENEYHTRPNSYEKDSTSESRINSLEQAYPSCTRTPYCRHKVSCTTCASKESVDTTFFKCECHFDHLPDIGPHYQMSQVKTESDVMYPVDSTSNTVLIVLNAEDQYHEDYDDEHIPAHKLSIPNTVQTVCYMSNLESPGYNMYNKRATSPSTVSSYSSYMEDSDSAPSRVPSNLYSSEDESHTVFIKLGFSDCESCSSVCSHESPNYKPTRPPSRRRPVTANACYTTREYETSLYHANPAEKVERFRSTHVRYNGISTTTETVDRIERFRRSLSTQEFYRERRDKIEFQYRGTSTAPSMRDDRTIFAEEVESESLVFKSTDDSMTTVYGLRMTETPQCVTVIESTTCFPSTSIDDIQSWDPRRSLQFIPRIVFERQENSIKPRKQTIQIREIEENPIKQNTHVCENEETTYPKQQEIHIRENQEDLVKYLKQKTQICKDQETRISCLKQETQTVEHQKNKIKTFKQQEIQVRENQEKLMKSLKQDAQIRENRQNSIKPIKEESQILSEKQDNLIKEETQIRENQKYPMKPITQETQIRENQKYPMEPITQETQIRENQKCPMKPITQEAQILENQKCPMKPITQEAQILENQEMLTILHESEIRLEQSTNIKINSTNQEACSSRNTNQNNFVKTQNCEQSETIKNYNNMTQKQRSSIENESVDSKIWDKMSTVLALVMSNDNTTDASTNIEQDTSTEIQRITHDVEYRRIDVDEKNQFKYTNCHESDNTTAIGTTYSERDLRDQLETLYDEARQVKSLEKLYVEQEEKIARRQKIVERTIRLGKISILEGISPIKKCYVSSISLPAEVCRDMITEASEHTVDRIQGNSCASFSVADSSDIITIEIPKRIFHESPTNNDENATSSMNTPNMIRITRVYKETIGRQIYSTIEDNASKITNSRVVINYARNVRNVGKKIKNKIDCFRKSKPLVEPSPIHVESYKNPIDLSMIRRNLVFDANIVSPDLTISDSSYAYRLSVRPVMLMIRLKHPIKCKLTRKIKIKKIKIKPSSPFKKPNHVNTAMSVKVDPFHLNHKLGQLFFVKKTIKRAMLENEKSIKNVGLSQDILDFHILQPRLISINNNFKSMNCDNCKLNIDINIPTMISNVDLPKVNFDISNCFEAIHVSNIDLGENDLKLNCLKLKDFADEKPYGFIRNETSNLIIFSEEEMKSNHSDMSTGKSAEIASTSLQPNSWTTLTKQSKNNVSTIRSSSMSCDVISLGGLNRLLEVTPELHDELDWNDDLNNIASVELKNELNPNEQAKHGTGIMNTNTAASHHEDSINSESRRAFIHKLFGESSFTIIDNIFGEISFAIENIGKRICANDDIPSKSSCTTSGDMVSSESSCPTENITDAGSYGMINTTFEETSCVMMNENIHEDIIAVENGMYGEMSCPAHLNTIEDIMNASDNGSLGNTHHGQIISTHVGCGFENDFSFNFHDVYEHMLETLSERTEFSNSFTSSEILACQLKTKLSNLKKSLSFCLSCYVGCVESEFDFSDILKGTCEHIVENIATDANIPKDAFQLQIMNPIELKIESSILIQTRDHCYRVRHHIHSSIKRSERKRTRKSKPRHVICSNTHSYEDVNSDRQVCEDLTTAMNIYITESSHSLNLSKFIDVNNSLALTPNSEREIEIVTNEQIYETREHCTIPVSQEEQNKNSEIIIKINGKIEESNHSISCESCVQHSSQDKHISSSDSTKISTDNLSALTSNRKTSRSLKNPLKYSKQRKLRRKSITPTTSSPKNESTPNNTDIATSKSLVIPGSMDDNENIIEVESPLISDEHKFSMPEIEISVPEFLPLSLFNESQWSMADTAPVPLEEAYVSPNSTINTVSKFSIHDTRTLDSSANNPRNIHSTGDAAIGRIPSLTRLTHEELDPRNEGSNPDSDLSLPTSEDLSFLMRWQRWQSLENERISCRPEISNLLPASPITPSPTSCNESSYTSPVAYEFSSALESGLLNSSANHPSKGPNSISDNLTIECLTPSKHISFHIPSTTPVRKTLKNPLQSWKKKCKARQTSSAPTTIPSTAQSHEAKDTSSWNKNPIEKKITSEPTTVTTNRKSNSARDTRSKTKKSNARHITPAVVTIPSTNKSHQTHSKKSIEKKIAHEHAVESTSKSIHARDTRGWSKKSIDKKTTIDNTTVRSTSIQARDASMISTMSKTTQENGATSAGELARRRKLIQNKMKKTSKMTQCKLPTRTL